MRSATAGSTDETEERGRGGARVLRTVPPLALLAYAAVLFATSPGDAWRVEWDSALYLLTGKALAAGEGYTYHGEPFFLRPPGLAWLVSLFVEDGEVAFAPLNLALRALAAAGVAAIYLCLRAPFGRPLALAVALLTGTSALFLDLLPWVLSDLAFLAFLFGALALLEHALGAPRERWTSAAFGALLLAAAVHLRSTAILVLPGLALLPLVRLRGRARLAGVAPAVLALLACLPWTLHARAAASAAPRPAEELMLFDYPTALLHVDPGDPGSARVGPEVWRQRAALHAPAIARELTWTAWHADPGWLQATWGLLAALGLALAVRRGLGVRESWFLATALLLVVYFAFARRLLLPLVPAVYLYPLVAVRAAARRVGAAAGRAWLGDAAALGVAAALLAVNLSGLPRHPGHGDLVARDSGTPDPVHLVDLAAWLRENTPEDAVLLCGQAPPLELLSGRTAYTFRFLRQPGALKRYGVDYLVLDTTPKASLERRARERATGEWPVPVRGRTFPVTVLRLGEPAER